MKGGTEKQTCLQRPETMPMGAITRFRYLSKKSPPPANATLRAEPPPRADERAQRDRQMLLAAQRGSREAFVTLVESYQGAVFGYLRSRLLEPADAEDLCQEVFLRCFTGKARYDVSAAVRPWLVGVARNVLREHIRAVTRRQEVAWTELCLELETMMEGDDGLYDDVLGHLPACFDALGQSARQALELHYRDQYKLTEIGERLRRSLGAVKLLMYRARQALKRCLDGRVARENHV